jgi:asparagine N-glycosylation enzyme membrane subunit Stt3
VGTWLLFGAGLSTVSFGVAEAFATGFLLLFVVVPLLATLAPARRDGEPSDEADGVMLAVSAASYFGYSLFLLGRSGHGDLRGLFTFGLAAAFAGLAGLARAVAPRDVPMRRYLGTLCVAATTVAIPASAGRAWRRSASSR